MFLASTDARVGEAKHLRWKDVAYDEENVLASLTLLLKQVKKENSVLHFHIAVTFLMN